MVQDEFLTLLLALRCTASEFLILDPLSTIFPIIKFMKTVVATCFIFLVWHTAFAQESPLFESLSPAKTGIHFKNILEESPTSNVLTYEYFYNGGGVAIGDINNDGLEDIYFTGNMKPNALYLNGINIGMRTQPDVNSVADG